MGPKDLLMGDHLELALNRDQPTTAVLDFLVKRIPREVLAVHGVAAYGHLFDVKSHHAAQAIAGVAVNVGAAGALKTTAPV